MKDLSVNRSPLKYQKALARLEKSIRSGQFVRFTRQKKQQSFDRLLRYARQLNINIKQTVVTACLAAGLCIAQPSHAQTFTLTSGSANPASVVTGGTYYKPAFVDIDGDGDMDAFFGLHAGFVKYYRNTGSKSAPILTEQTGANNPLNSIVSPLLASPTFTDIDGDGDMDAFVGQANGDIRYFKNTGTKTAPVFTAQTGTNNPLSGLSLVGGGYSNSAPAFADIDGDGDMDLFKGSAKGNVLYFKNTGTVTAPAFTAQTGAANVLNSVKVDFFSTPSFVDIDGDGDMDVIVGAYYEAVQIWKNTGTKLMPVFTIHQTGANDLFSNQVNSAPAFVDIDGDGDMDAFFGANSGISYYKNTSAPLPLHLIGFSGTRQENANLLQWSTTEEVNTSLFEIQRSSDAKAFTTIATVNTNNKKSNSYSLLDHAVYSGNIFYRLKMVDLDDTYAYSRIITVRAQTDNTFSMYPNPASGIVNIKNGSTVLAETHAQLYDASGRLNQSIYINSQQQMDINQLASGLYMVRFEDGSVQRLIKK